MGFSKTALTRDQFLGGRLIVQQPESGYRAGVDPVILAASVNIQSGQSALELGCGVGVASLCLAARVKGLHLTGIELQADYLELAQENARYNHKECASDFRFYCADVNGLPPKVMQTNYDHVFTNPPYFNRTHGAAARDAGREMGRGETVTLANWIDIAVRRLKPLGYLTVIMDSERLRELLSAMDHRLGGVKILPFAPRQNRDAKLVVVQARKTGRGAFRLLTPMVMHQGATHTKDQDSYTDEIRAVLRDGAALNNFS